MSTMLEKPMSSRAFIIGPIGDKGAADGTEARKAYEDGIQVLEEVIAPACTALGLDPLRADQIATTGEIPEQVFRYLRDSPVVIADLTGANPNVMYELGLRHTTGKLTVQIGERSRLPFDISAIRTIIFKRTDSGLIEARKQLVKTLAAGLESSGEPVSATRVWFETSKTGTSDTATNAASEMGEEPDDAGFLELLAEAEDAGSMLTGALSTATAITQEISRIFTEGTAKIGQLNEQGANTAAKLAIANRIAALLEEPADKLQVAAGDYSQCVNRMEPGLLYMFSQIEADPTQLAAAGDAPQMMKLLIAAAATSVDQILGFRGTVDAIGRATRAMRKACARISSSLLVLAESSKRVATWAEPLERALAASGAAQEPKQDKPSAE